jgi:hypothetical protein
VTLPAYMAESGETWSAVGGKKFRGIRQAQSSTFWLIFGGPTSPL